MNIQANNYFTSGDDNVRSSNVSPNIRSIANSVVENALNDSQNQPFQKDTYQSSKHGKNRESPNKRVNFDPMSVKSHFGDIDIDEDLDHRREKRLNLLTSIKSYIHRAKTDKRKKTERNSFAKNRLYQRQLERNRELEKYGSSYKISPQYFKDLEENNTLIYEKGMKEFKAEVSETQKRCVFLLKQRVKGNN